MARTNSAANTRITNSSFGGAAASGTISIWVNPGWSSGSSAVHPIWQLSNTATSDEPSFQDYSDNNIYAGFGAGRIVVSDAGLFTSGTWANWVFTWSGSGCALFKNASSIGTAAAPTISAQTGYCLGNYPAAVGFDSPSNTTLAEFCYWNVVLTSGEIAALANGINTQIVRPGAIQLYVPLWGLASPEPELSGNAFNGTLSGTVSYAPHAPVTLWTPKMQTFLSLSGDTFANQQPMMFM